MKSRIIHSAETFEIILESSHDAMVIVNRDGVITLINNRAGELFGYERDTLVGQKIEIIIPDRFKGIHPALRSTFFSNPHARPMGKGRELYARKKDGSEFPVEIGLTPLETSEGTMTLAAIIDITERKMIESVRLEQESYRKFQAIIEHTFDAITLRDSGGKLIYQSPGFGNMLGYTFEEIKEIEVATLFHPDDIPDLLTRTATTRGNPGLPVFGVNRMKHKDGHYIWVEGTVTNLLDDVNVKAFVGHFRDITEKKLAEQKLEENEKKFRALVENNFEAMVLLNDKGIVTYVSPSTEKLMGYTFEEFIGKDGSVFFHPDEMDVVFKRMQTALQNPGKPIYTQNRVRHKDGHYIWTEGTTTNFLHDEHVRAFVGNFRDITERKLHEAKIIQANRLYSFLSQINQTIVHAGAEQTVFKEVCRIAIEIGKLKGAWVGVFDRDYKKITVVAQSGVIPTSLLLLIENNPVRYLGSVDHILSKGSYYLCNDIENEYKNGPLKQIAIQSEYRSAMVLPVFLSGNLHAVFSIYADQKQFFGKDEIDLLVEATNDISFALNVFEKERHRKEMEHKLIHNESHLKQAQAIAHIGSWERDLVTGVTKWSEEACRIFGIPIENNNHSFESHILMIHPEDRSGTLEKITHSLASGTGTEFQFRIVRNDQSIRYIYAKSHIETDCNGVPISTNGILLDVTGQTLAEQKIMQANRLYAFVSEINHTIIRVTDEQALFNEACRIAIEIGRFDMAWISFPDRVNQRLRVAAHYNVSGSDYELLDNLHYDDAGPTTGILQTGKFYVINDFENELRDSGMKEYALRKGFRSKIILPIKKAGEVIYLFSIFSAQSDLFDAQEIVLLEEVCDDISFALDVFEKEKRRKEAEDKLIHSELRMKQAQSIAHFGSWELDFQTRRSFWSDEVYRIYGVAPSRTNDPFNSWMSFIHPNDLEYVIKTISEVEGKINNKGFHHRILRPDGTVRYVYSQAQIEIGETGKPLKIVGVSHDETEIVEAEKEKERMMRDILQRNKDLEQFSYIISHNLRAPVANIIGITNLFNLYDQNFLEKNEIIEKLSYSVHKMDEVIMDLNNILQVGKNISERKEKVILSEILDNLIMDNINIMNVNNVDIQFDFTVIDELFSLKNYINSIFYNLISNSIKFRQPGIPPVIEISSSKKGDKVELIFKDNGLGIDLERRRSQVFGLYKRFHPFVEGKGMGLFMVKSQVQSLGGTIEVFSEVNKGTEFRITFDIE